SARVNVIIRVDSKPSKVHETKLAALGGDVYRHLPIINSLALSVPPKNVSRLLRLSFVRHLSLDERVEKTDLFTVPSSRADTAWQQYGVDGSNVGVAVVDSGVSNEPDFNNLLLFSRVKIQVNFVPGTPVYDECGHGTHVAGIAA